MPRFSSSDTIDSSLSDEALVVRAQRGDVDAFAEVVARFEGRLFNFIARRVGHRRSIGDAEDLTQETFLRAWRSIADYRPKHRFSTWLFTIASRLVVDQLRHAAVKADSMQEVGFMQARRHGDSEPSHIAVVSDSHDEGRTLWSIAAEILTHEQHAALWLRYAEDLSPAEIARVLERNEVAVRVMLFRTRQAIAAHVNALRSTPSSMEVALAAGDSR